MEKNLIDESKRIGSSMFQNFWIGFMFTFLWLLVGFSVIFLTPTHAKIMASKGRTGNWLLINALSLYVPIFIGTILCLLLMGISKIRIIKNSSTDKRRLELNRSAAMGKRKMGRFYLIHQFHK